MNIELDRLSEFMSLSQQIIKKRENEVKRRKVHTLPRTNRDTT